MSKLAFIYPGQGVQSVGMGKDFYDNSALSKEIFDNASNAIDLDLKKICFEENDLINQTEYTQAALVTTYLAMTRELMAKGVKPDMTAGLSLGEYAAISVAGAMKDMDAVKLVRKRGILMQNTVPLGVGAMCAVLALDEKIIEEVIADIDGVTIANYNCPGQIVITGKMAAVEEAAAKLKEAGAKRTVMLNVSGPFHSPLLEVAGAELKAEIEKIELGNLNIPYVTNVTAGIIEDKSMIADLLTRQMYSPVKWMQSMDTMINAGVDTFVEIGPGKTLEGFLKKINKEVKVLHVSTMEDLEQTF